MELEFAFFDSQIQRSTDDGKPKQVTRADTTLLESSSVQPRGGSEGASDHERFRGVHERVALLCVDFDDTLTDGDTTSLLIEAAKAEVRFGCSACDFFPLCTCCTLWLVWSQFRAVRWMALRAPSLTEYGIFGLLARGSGIPVKTRRLLNVSGRC